MTDFQKILFKIVALIVILIISNIIYVNFQYEKDIQAHSDIIDLVGEVQDTSEIIYIGESSNFTYHKNDIDKRSISQLIASYYPNKKLGPINKGAIHANIFIPLLNHIPENSNVETIIVTLNLRSFGADWIYSKLETALQKSIVLLKPYPPIINRFLLSFKGYPIRDDEENARIVRKKWGKDILHFPYDFPYKNVNEWDVGMWNTGIKNADGTKNIEKSQLACHYIKTYAFQLDSDKNPRIKDFDKLVILAKKRNWNLVFNLMAENVEQAEALVGKDLIYLIDQNRKFLIDRYQKKGVIVVDNLDNVPDEEYIDRNWTTEHYTEKGRKIIARNVADSMKTIYPEEYR